VLPNRRHHPFSRQPEQRYNTLDFACGKIVRQRADRPAGCPAILSPAGPIPENHRFQNGAALLKNAKTDAAFHRCRMKSCVCFSGKAALHIHRALRRKI